MTGACIRWRFAPPARDAGACVAVVLAVSLVAGPRDAPVPGFSPSGPQVAEADRAEEGARGMWFRLGDLLADVARRGRTPDRDREQPGVDRDAEHLGAPLDIDIRSLIDPDPGR